MISKFKCIQCNATFLSDENPATIICPFENDPNHKVRVQPKNADDYAEIWSNELESENHHSLTEMPAEILKVLRTEISDEKLVRVIMLKLYDARIGE